MRVLLLKLQRQALWKMCQNITQNKATYSAVERTLQEGSALQQAASSAVYTGALHVNCSNCCFTQFKYELFKARWAIQPEVTGPRSFNSSHSEVTSVTWFPPHVLCFCVIHFAQTLPLGESSKGEQNIASVS